MADLVTRLLLQNKSFDNALKNSGNQVDKFGKRTANAGKGVADFQGKIGNLASRAGAGLIKFAGVAGLAIGGVEALEKTMRGSQTTSDMFDNNMNAARDSVNMFFSSLSRGDWTAFQNGLIETFTRLKDLSAVLDELADKKLSLNYIKADQLSKIEEFERIAKDTTKPLEVREKAARNMANAVNDLNKAVKETGEFNMDALLKGYNTKSGFNFTSGDLETFVKQTNFTGTATAEAQTAYKEFVRLKKETENLNRKSAYDANTNGFDPNRKYQAEYRQKKAEYEAYAQQNEELIKQGWLTEEVDDKRKEMIQTLIEQLGIEREISALGKRADETMRGIDTAKKTETNTQKTAAESKEKRNITFSESINDADEWIRKQLRERIEEMPDVPVEIRVAPKFVESEEENDTKGSIIDIQKQIQDVTTLYSEATTDALRVEYAKRKADLEKHLEEMTDLNNGMIDLANETSSLINNGVVNAFESIGNAISADDAGESMREMLIGMMDLLKQFGAAMVAAGMAKLAFDKLLLNPIAAIAAGGTLIIATSVAKSALQKAAKPMADGGIVYGETFARVGEYPGASTNPEVVAPLNKLRSLIQPEGKTNDMWGRVEFVIDGTNLRGVYKNCERKEGRSR